MKTTAFQTITNILNEDGTVASSITVERWRIVPDDGKILKNIKTGQLFRSTIFVNNKNKVADYIEIEDPNTSLKEYLDSI